MLTAINTQVCIVSLELAIILNKALGTTGIAKKCSDAYKKIKSARVPVLMSQRAHHRKRWPKYVAPFAILFETAYLGYTEIYKE